MIPGGEWSLPPSTVTLRGSYPSWQDSQHGPEAPESPLAAWVEHQMTLVPNVFTPRHRAEVWYCSIGHHYYQPEQFPIVIQLRGQEKGLVCTKHFGLEPKPAFVVSNLEGKHKK